MLATAGAPVILGVALVTGVVALLALPLVGWRRWLFTGITVLACLPSVRLWWGAPSNPVEIQSISPAYVAVTALDLVLLAGVVFLPAGPSVHRSVWRALPLVLYLLAGLVAWPLSQTVASGIQHAVTCLAAFILGIRLSDFVRTGDEDAVWGARVLAAVSVVVLLIPSAIQVGLGQGVDGYGDRTGGVFGHPSTLGKDAVVLTAVALPLLSSPRREVRRPAMWAVAASVVATLPTLSRANIAALALMLGVWVLLNARERGTRRLVTGGIVIGILSIPFVFDLIDRFIRDPAGNERPLLLEAFFRQFPTFWLSGLGPNNYTTEMQHREQVVAALGYPVHNAGLLILGEIGLAGVCALLPLLIPIVAASLKALSPHLDGDRRMHARALLVLIVGLVTVGWTGWGIARAPTAQLVCFFVATQYAIVARQVAANSKRGQKVYWSTTQAE